jgi:hypothetical protein
MMRLNFLTVAKHRLVDDAFDGQEATVLQLPAQPTTAAEEEAQKRVAYTG